MFSAGTYNGDAYDEGDLDNMVKAFGDLKGRVDPPVKLGHNDKQVAAKEFGRDDGKPALGWVSNLYRKGKLLLADFAEVPAKVAELVKAGAYRKVSSEILWNFKDGGKVYPRALKAVALLGADMPANRDISSLHALYDDQGNEYRVAEYAADAATANPYGDPDDLPPEVKAQLPDKARQVWMEAHNAVCGMMDSGQAWDVAWSAVRKAGYGPPQEQWVRYRQEGGQMDRTYKEWSAAQINDLPDAAFALIKPGGQKDDEGKTAPRDLRMLPHHGPGVEDPMDHDSVDMPHLRNALARMGQADMPAAMKRRALEHLQAHGKAKGMEGDEIDTMTKEVKRMGELEELTRKYGELETQVKGYADRLTAAESQAKDAEQKASDAETARQKAEGDAKGYADRLTAAETKLAEETKARRMSELRQVAADFPRIPGTEVEKAEKLYRLEQADPKLYEERVTEWRALDEQLAAGDLFGQRAYAQDAPGDGSAMARFDGEVKKLTDQGKSVAEATEAVASHNPRLYGEYQTEHARRAKAGSN